MTKFDPLKVRIAIPHFFNEVDGGTGYGSGRPGQCLARSIALGRCLSSLLTLRRSPDDAVLNIGNRCIKSWNKNKQRNQRLEAIEVEIHVFTDGKHQLNDVLALYDEQILIHRLALDNPRLLPLAARNWLIRHETASNLNIYLEDDIIITDPLFLDKQYWFLNRTEEKLVLMPHRFEPAANGTHARLLVDGPLRTEFISRFCTPQNDAVRGRFDPYGEEIHFDITDNPHSGCFVIGAKQAEILRYKDLPNDGFVGPLESAATLTVLQHFPVLKAAAPNHQFLSIEHGHTSFLNYLKTFPHC